MQYTCSNFYNTSKNTRDKTECIFKWYDDNIEPGPLIHFFKLEMDEWVHQSSWPKENDPNGIGTPCENVKFVKNWNNEIRSLFESIKPMKRD